MYTPFSAVVRLENTETFFAGLILARHLNIVLCLPGVAPEDDPGSPIGMFNSSTSVM